MLWLGERVARGSMRSREPTQCVVARGGRRCGGFPASTSGSGTARADGRRRFFWGRRSRRGVGVIADRGQHGEGCHDERDVAIPTVPGAGLVVVEAKLVPGGPEAVLDRPAMALGLHERVDPGSRRTCPTPWQVQGPVDEGVPRKPSKPRLRRQPAVAVLVRGKLGKRCCDGTTAARDEASAVGAFVADRRHSRPATCELPCAREAPPPGTPAPPARRACACSRRRPHRRRSPRHGGCPGR